MNNCGCNNESSTFKRSNKLGVFTANDVNNINTLPVVNASIIPFSSGISLSRVTDIFGNKTASLLGFGTARNFVPISNNTINLTNLSNEAFTVPRNGKITAISATYTPLGGNISVESVIVRAQIFLAPEGSNIFIGTSASVDLAPPLTLPFFEKISFASTNIPSVSVTVGDRLIMVFYIPFGTSVELDTISGDATAGITIL